MRPSPRLTQLQLQVPFLTVAKDPLSLLSFSTHQSPLCGKQRLHTCGFATAAESRFRVSVYSANSLLLKTQHSQAVCHLRISTASSSACISTSSEIQEEPCVRINTKKGSKRTADSKDSPTRALSSACISTSSETQEEPCVRTKTKKGSKRLAEGAQPAKKGAGKRKYLCNETAGPSDEEKCRHSVGESGEKVHVAASRGELIVSKVNNFVATCELNEENKGIQQNCETSIETTDQNCEASIETTYQNCEASIENDDVVSMSSRVCNGRETIIVDTILKKGRVSRRFKKKPEAALILLKLNMCSKLADLHGALEVYDKVKREGLIQMNIYNYNVLLYICSGAASGSLTKGRPKKEGKRLEVTTLQNSEHNDIVAENLEGSKDSDSSEENKEVVHFSSEDMELAATKGAEILEDMLQLGVEPNEATFTSIIRLAVAKNDGDLAFETIKLMASSGIPPKLRSYGPPLHCFCECNQPEKAFEVDDHMRESGVLPDESMLDSLLRVSIEAGLEDKVYSLLQRLRMTVRDLLPTTVKSIERWFNSEAAAFAGKAKWENLPSEEELRQATEASGGGWHGMGWLGKGTWQVRRTRISKTGSCTSCGEELCTIDLDPQDTENFANCIEELACQREQEPNGFKAFQKWLDMHGPFDAIVDGANVALYNPKVYRGFSFMLLNAVVKATRTKISPQRPPLVLLHNRHGPRIGRTPADEQVLNKWRRENALFFTPQGSNDDWFWLYAAVKCKCMLVTNDEMRDHIFELLGNDFFPKWKERHQVRFTFTAKGLEIHMPPPYSIVIQESQNGSWHVPQAGGDDIEAPREWLCVSRAETTSS